MGGAGAGAEATKKAVRATASAGDDGASVTPVKPQQQKQKPAPLPAAAVAGSGGTDGSAPAVHHQSCSAEEDQADDEQVERFYALLANIRALRGLYSAGTGPASSGRPGSRKRAREAEPPWTPSFRLEDFDHEVNQGASAADDARYAVTNQGASGGVARRPAAAAARGGAAVAAAADDGGHEEDGVAEVARGGGSKLGRRRVAARG